MDRAHKKTADILTASLLLAGACICTVLWLCFVLGGDEWQGEFKDWSHTL